MGKAAAAGNSGDEMQVEAQLTEGEEEATNNAPAGGSDAASEGGGEEEEEYEIEKIIDAKRGMFGVSYFKISYLK